MKILVEHEVPCEKRMEQTCLYPGDFWGNGVCKYHTHRDRTHGRKLQSSAGCRSAPCSMSGFPGNTRSVRNVWRRREVGKNGYLERRKVRDTVMQDAIRQTYQQYMTDMLI